MTEELIRRLKKTRRNLYQEARAILERAEAEGRDLTAAEDKTYRELADEMDALTDRIEQFTEQMESNERVDRALEELRAKPVVAGHVAKPSKEEQKLAEEFRDRVRRQSREPIEIPMTARRSGFSPGLEARSLTTGSAGGLVPSSFYERVVQHLVETNAVLAAGATLIMTEDGASLSVPASTAFSSAQIVAEGGTIPSSDPSLTVVPLPVWKYGFLTQITYELATDASFDILGFLAQQAAEALSSAFSAHFIAGTGSNQPKGLLNSVTVGKTGSGVTPTYEDLIDLQHSVASPYARADRAAWIMSHSMLAEVRKLTDANDRPLFEFEVPRGTGAAGMLLGRPVFTDAAMPDPGEGETTILFGDLSRYVVRFAGQMRWERSDDYAFNTDLISFRALWRVGGALADTTGAIKAFVSGPAA